MTPHSRPVATLLALTCAAACSSQYTPRRGPRVSMVMEASGPSLVKDGIVRPLGVLGGGLPDTVADHPVALEHADEFHTRMTTSLAMVIGGVGLIAASPVTLQFGNRDQLTNVAPAAAMITGGLALYAAGLFVMLSAQPHLYDAINVYNDAVDERRFGALGSAPAKLTPPVAGPVDAAAGGTPTTAEPAAP